MPAINKLFLIVSIKAAPMNAPNVPPTPPIKFAPPITVAAITLNS